MNGSRALFAVGVVAIAFLAAVAVTNTFRWSRSDSDAALRASTDSADVRVGRLTAEVFAAEAREAALRDSVVLLRRERVTLRALAGAERHKSDSLWAFALRMDSVAMPRALVQVLVGSLHAERDILGQENKGLLLEVAYWQRLYTSADSGRAALFVALHTQAALTQAWRAVAEPPLFSLRRFRLGPGCAAGFGGGACGVAVTYVVNF